MWYTCIHNNYQFIDVKNIAITFKYSKHYKVIKSSTWYKFLQLFCFLFNVCNNIWSNKNELMNVMTAIDLFALVLTLTGRNCFGTSQFCKRCGSNAWSYWKGTNKHFWTQWIYSTQCQYELWMLIFFNCIGYLNFQVPAWA